MLLILTPVVDFINILQATFLQFTFAEKLQTKTSSAQNQFKTILYKKSTPKMFLILTPVVNLNNILCTIFLTIRILMLKNY